MSFFLFSLKSHSASSKKTTFLRNNCKCISQGNYRVLMPSQFSFAVSFFNLFFLAYVMYCYNKQVCMKTWNSVHPFFFKTANKSLHITSKYFPVSWLLILSGLHHFEADTVETVLSANSSTNTNYHFVFLHNLYLRHLL